MWGPHMDVPVNLTLLAGQACVGHGGHIRRCMFPYKPREDEASGGPRARVGNSMDHLKPLLTKRAWDYWPEHAGADIAEYGVALHVLHVELQALVRM